MEVYMKKIALILLAIMLAASLIACNNGGGDEDDTAGVADYAKPSREQSVVVDGETVGTISYEDDKGNTAIITDYIGKYTSHKVVIGETVGEGSSKLTVTKIGNEAFYYCTAATEIVLPTTLTHIGDWAFAGCVGLESITIPASVVSIGKGAFNGCENLKTVIFEGDALKTIGDYAFNDCTALETLHIPKNVESIGAKAFGDCEKLTSIKTPATLKSIGDMAFYGCKGLNAEGALDLSASVNIEVFTAVVEGVEVKVADIGKHVFAGIKKDYIVVPEDENSEIAKYVAAMPENGTEDEET